MYQAIQYIYTTLFEPIIASIMSAFINIGEALFSSTNLFIEPLTITLFSDTPIVTTNLVDITMVILTVLFSIWFAKFIVYILKVPFKFFARLGR